MQDGRIVGIPRRWLRFIVGGGLNTGITYAIFYVLHLVLHYQVAYAIAFLVGVGFSYFFNVIIVFSAPLSLKGFLAYPAVYIAQYLAATLALGIMVEGMGISASLAPLFVVVAMVPFTYFLTRWVILYRGDKEK